jgi:hypothetical protein
VTTWDPFSEDFDPDAVTGQDERCATASRDDWEEWRDD